MPAPLLRHYKIVLPAAAAGAWHNITPLVGNQRSLVVAKMTITRVAGGAGTSTFDVCLDAAPSDAGKIANRVPLGLAELWVSRNLVLIAGERIHVYLDGGTSTDLAVNVFGQEVDNL